MWQDILVLIIALGAIGYLILRFSGSKKSGNGSGCHDCASSGDKVHKKH